MNDEPAENLIDPFRNAGIAYVDSFKGDLQAVCADLRRRAEAEHRQVVALPPKPPAPWHVKEAERARKAV
jgi:hypothetical protein